MPLPMSPQSSPGMFAQMAQQGGSPPSNGPSAPPSPSNGPQQMNPAIILQMIQRLPPQIQKLLAQQIIQNTAAQGRGGDTMIAHLTPGEKTVPPEVQTPKVLATLDKAYKEKGVSPAQFTAGTPQSSKNPSTGLPEYNFMSAFLPAAMGIAGSVAMPYLAPEIGSTLLASSVGAGLGTTAGGLVAGQSPTQAALSGLGAGAGGYGMGSLMGGGSSAAMNAAGVAPGASSSASSSAADATTGFPGHTMTDAAMGHAPILGSQALGNAAANFNPYQAAGSTVGSMIGNSIGAPPKSKGPVYPPGFNTPMDPVGSKGSAQDQLGMTNSIQPRPNFNGYNPATNFPASYNFFPQA